MICLCTNFQKTSLENKWKFLQGTQNIQIQNIADFDFDISDSNKTITAHWSQANITKRSTKLEIEHIHTTAQ